MVLQGGAREHGISSSISAPSSWWCKTLLQYGVIVSPPSGCLGEICLEGILNHSQAVVETAFRISIEGVMFTGQMDRLLKWVICLSDRYSNHFGVDAMCLACSRAWGSSLANPACPFYLAGVRQDGGKGSAELAHCRSEG